MKKIEKVRRQRGIKWKALVNEALRLGLVQMESKSSAPTQPPTRPQSLGRCLIGEIISVSEALALG